MDLKILLLFFYKIIIGAASNLMSYNLIKKKIHSRYSTLIIYLAQVRRGVFINTNFVMDTHAYQLKEIHIRT